MDYQPNYSIGLATKSFMFFHAFQTEKSEMTSLPINIIKNYFNEIPIQLKLIIIKWINQFN